MDKKLICNLSEVGIDNVGEVGGKNASLGEMYRKLTKNGVKVPNGFATTAYAYNYFMEKSEMIFGTRAVMEAIHAKREIEKIFVQSGLNNDLIKELIQVAKSNGVPFTFVPQEKLNRLSTKNHQGVICLLAAVKYASLEGIIDLAYQQGREPFLLIVDRVTDVRNFGAIARTAECAGLDAIIMGDSGNAPITGDAMKTSAGALSHLPVCRVKDMKKTCYFLMSGKMSF